MFIRWRPFLVCVALRLLNLAWASSDQIWPPTQVLCKESARNELGYLKNNMTAVSSISEFDGFIKKTMLWVDKSLLIKAIFEGEQGISKDVIWVTSSPRWGKTLNLNTFAFYCELYTDDEGALLDREKSPAYQYFVNGSIVENGKVIDKTYPQPPLISSYEGNKEHIANYSVIRLHGGKLDMETGISSIRTLIHEAYRLQIPLLKRLRDLSTCGGNPSSNKSIAERNLNIFESYYDWNKIMAMESSELQIGIQRLCDILKSTYDRMVVIVFDDFDHFIHAAYFGDFWFRSTTETSHFLGHLNQFMVATFKDNQSLKKALITGVLSINDENKLSGLNSAHKSCVFDYDNIFPFYGIFDWELEKMMEFRGLDTKHFDVQSSLEFDGFRSLANLTAPMFSTYSVANFISFANPRVTSHQPTGCIVNILTKMSKYYEFRHEMRDFVEKSNDTFLQILYDEFHSFSLYDCKSFNEIMHGGECYYQCYRHHSLMYSLLLKFGLATLAKRQIHVHSRHPEPDDLLDIKISNKDALYYIKSKIPQRMY